LNEAIEEQTQKAIDYSIEENQTKKEVTFTNIE
jgi:hypothetical protein